MSASRQKQEWRRWRCATPLKLNISYIGFFVLSAQIGAVQIGIGIFLYSMETHSVDPGDSDCETVLDQLYQAYAESHENDPPEIRDRFKELDKFLEGLSLDDNNADWNLCDKGRFF